MAAPLLGYNTNLQHQGKTYHVQTEDSGVEHPHVITHLFADGGRIIASCKESYAEVLDAQDRDDQVRRRMHKQHRTMCAALEQGRFDERLGRDSASHPPLMLGQSTAPARRNSSASFDRNSLDEALLRSLRADFGE